MGHSCIVALNQRSVNSVDVTRNANQSCPEARGGKARGAWEFINLSAPKDAKVASLRRIVRVQAAKNLQFKSRPKERAPRAHADAPVKPQAVISEQSEIPKADYAIPHQELSVLPNKLPRWPNQLEQLLLEAELLSKSLPPGTGQEHTKNDDSTHDSYATLIADLLSPTTRLDSSLGSGIADPFNAFPSKHCSQDYELVSHCKPSTTPHIIFVYARADHQAQELPITDQLQSFKSATSWRPSAFPLTAATASTSTLFAQSGYRS